MLIHFPLFAIPYQLFDLLIDVKFFFVFQAARRQMQVEAAERRRQEAESRGIKNPEKVSRLQQRADRIEQAELEASKRGEPVLRVNIPSNSMVLMACDLSFSFLPVDF